MDIRQLRYFVMLAHTLQFSRAAENLHISQPTLSQQISQMEDELGGPLFIRNNRSVELSPIGIDLLKDAERLIHDFDKTIARVTQNKQSPYNSSTLKIGVDVYDTGLERIDGIRVISELQQIEPKAIIQLMTIPIRKIDEALQRHSLDVGLYTVPPGWGKDLTCCCQVLRRDHLCVVCSRQVANRNSRLDLRSLVASMPVMLVRGDVVWNSYIIPILSEISPGFTYQYLDSVKLVGNQIDTGFGYYVTTLGCQAPYEKDPMVVFELDPRITALDVALYRSENTNPLRDCFLELLLERL